LSLDNFVATKISWKEKPDSIRELAQELSLGLDSFVFVDDNPVECEAIRQQLPEIAVIEAPIQEPWKLVELLSSQRFFDAAVVTDDDVNRLNEYKAQAQRAELAGSADNRDEFLASLEIVCTFLSALDAPLARSVQLLAKTNQFNLTTRRYTEQEISDLANRPDTNVLSIRLRDRYCDHGLVGVAITRDQATDCEIDTFLLSCRVIGRTVETALLSQLAQAAVRRGQQRLLGWFVPTKKNAPAKEFYAQHGFELQSQNTDGSLWALDLAQRPIACPAWIKLDILNGELI